MTDPDFEPGPTKDSDSDSQGSDAEPASSPRLLEFCRGRFVVPMPSPARPTGFARGAYVVSRSSSDTWSWQRKGKAPSQEGYYRQQAAYNTPYVGVAPGEAAQPGVGAAPIFTLPMTAVPTLASQYVRHSQVSISVILLLELLKWAIFS